MKLLMIVLAAVSVLACSKKSDDKSGKNGDLGFELSQEKALVKTAGFPVLNQNHVVGHWCSVQPEIDSQIAFEGSGKFLNYVLESVNPTDTGTVSTRVGLEGTYSIYADGKVEIVMRDGAKDVVTITRALADEERPVRLLLENADYSELFEPCY